MGMSVEQYRACIGLFHSCVGVKDYRSSLYFWSFIYPNFVFYNWVLKKLLLACGDIERNPGPVINNNKHSVNIGHVNIWSILAPYKVNNEQVASLKKFDLVKQHILYHNYDVFGISETWLDQNDKNDSLQIKGYQDPIRRDKNGHQGGILVYLSADAPVAHRPDLEPLNSEIIAVELNIKRQKVLICNCYRPPQKDVIDFCDDIENIVTSARQEFSSIIFMGDTNGRNSEFWANDKTTPEGRALKAMFDTLLFDQLIDEPTRIMGDTKSCIDHIFVNNTCIIENVGVRPKIASDHCVIHATLTSKIPKPKSYKRMVWDYKRGDYDKFRFMLLNAPWYSCYSSTDINEVVDNWMTLFTLIAEACIPHYETTIRPNDKDFMNSDIRRTIRSRDRLWQQHRKSNNDDVYQKYKLLRNKVVNDIREAQIENEKKTNDAISNTNVGSKKWWSLYKSIISGDKSPSLGPLRDNDTIITDDGIKAELLNNFFVSQTMIDDSQTSLPSQIPTPTYKIDQKVIFPIDVYAILIKLDTTKATGPDGIGNKLLKEAAVPIAEPLSQLFNFSLSLGKFPDIWKIANVIPIFKKGDRMLCNNYRPISLLCCISKVFEKIVYDHIYAYLKRHGLITEKQSGFMQGDGTINQLISICNSLYKNLDDGDEVIGVFLDLTKAFGKVWHKGLMYKIEQKGICDKLKNCLHLY